MKNLLIKPLGTVSPYPSGNKNCPGYLIEYGEDKVLLDCGNGCTRLMNFEKDLEGLKIIISHLHPDHYGDLIPLLQAVYVYQRYGMLNNKPVIYIPNTDFEKEELYSTGEGWGFGKKEALLDYKYIIKYAKQAGVKVLGYDDLDAKFGDIEVSTLLVPHQIHSYAIKVKTNEGTIVYSSDTGTDNKLREFAKDCDLLICESTFLKGQYRKENCHLYAHEAALIASDANVKQLLLTHFWPNIDKKEYLKEALNYFKNTDVAEEGKTLTLRRGKNE